MADEFCDLEQFLEETICFHMYLPRAFILAFNCSSFVQPTKTFSASDEILFLLMFNIFSSFKHMADPKHEILFLCNKEKKKSLFYSESITYKTESKGY